MPADATAPGWAPIDVYADVVAGIGQRGHGQRRVPTPAPTGALEHGYQPPALDVAPIGRPTVWEETAADRDTVLARFDTLAGTRDEVGFGTLDGQRRRGLIVMLDWLAAFDGETWQQRWIASGLNDHGSRWTAQITDPRIRPTGHGRATLIGGAAALLLLDVVRPSYRWLFGFLSHPTLAEIQRHRDPEGFARLAELGAALPGFGPMIRHRRSSTSSEYWFTTVERSPRSPSPTAAKRSPHSSPTPCRNAPCGIGCCSTPALSTLTRHAMRIR